MSGQKGNVIEAELRVSGGGAQTADEDHVPVPRSIVVPAGGAITGDDEELDDVLAPGWEKLREGAFHEVLASARSLVEREPFYLYAYSQMLDAIDGLLGKEPLSAELRRERWRAAWTLLALCRRGVVGMHADYIHLYHQKSATVLAELALSAPDLVSTSDGKRLIAEALALPVDKSDQMYMTGTWDCDRVRDALTRS